MNGAVKFQCFTVGQDGMINKINHLLGMFVIFSTQQKKRFSLQRNLASSFEFLFRVTKEK